MSWDVPYEEVEEQEKPVDDDLDNFLTFESPPSDAVEIFEHE